MEAKGAILIISKNPDLQVACRQALEPGNFSVRSAQSLPEGIERARENIDIVLLDGETLSDQREGRFLPELLAKDRNLACILVSKGDSPDWAIQPIPEGVWDVIPFPVAPELLCLRVSQALEKRMNGLELKRLQAFEQNVAPLWSVAKGEMETSGHFDRDFLAPAAFRLTIAHEFRAPLTALQSFLLILLKGYVAPEKWKEMIQHAFDRSQDLLNLVDDLMNLATAKQEISQGNRSLVRLGDELEKVAPSFQTEANERGVTLTFTIRQNPVVSVNAIHVGQLWTNLISNAIKYTLAGGYVRVFLDQNAEQAIGTIEDSGIGISPQELNLVFHEFYRTAEARKMGVRGTGLGLPLVKRIVEGYGGSLEVKSAVAQGSVFRFALPLSASTASKDPTGGKAPLNFRRMPIRERDPFTQ